MLKGWTLQRATSIGIVAGVAALLTSVVVDAWPGTLVYPYVGLLLVTTLCGVSILWITATDMRERGTSGRMRPIRGFDVAVGLALLLPSLYALRLAWPDLGL